MGKRLLIVDDMPASREFLAAAFEDSYDIMLAGNGRQALDILEVKLQGLSAILLDLLMPGMNGYQLLEIMQERGWLDSIPVIVISTEADNYSKARCKNYGVKKFIDKKYDIGSARKCVEELLAG